MRRRSGLTTAVAFTASAITWFVWSGSTGQQWQLAMAAATISVAPTELLVLVLVLVLVLALQGHLVRAIALSGLGGR